MRTLATKSLAATVLILMICFARTKVEGDRIDAIAHPGCLSRAIIEDMA